MKFSLALILILSYCIMNSGCKKDSGSSSTFWHVKYEVVSTNAASKAVIIYMKETGTPVTVGNVSTSTYQQLPWSYEADYSKDAGLTAARNLSLSLVDIKSILATDKVTIKITVDGNIVNQMSNNSVVGMLVQYQLQ